MDPAAAPLDSAAAGTDLSAELAAAAALRRETPQLPLLKRAQEKFSAGDGTRALDPCGTDGEACDDPTGSFATAGALERMLNAPADASSAERADDASGAERAADSELLERTVGAAAEICAETPDKCAAAWDEVEEVASGLSARRRRNKEEEEG